MARPDAAIHFGSSDCGWGNLAGESFGLQFVASATRISPHPLEEFHARDL
jgi:hypothetical protein